MILSYSFPEFEKKIISGEKIHSFRRDPKLRWRPGMSIQHWRGNPRNKGSYQFWENVCWNVQSVSIYHSIDGIEMSIDTDDGLPNFKGSIEEIAKNDGLTLEEFTNFFVPNIGDVWYGKLIHWTEKQY